MIRFTRSSGGPPGSVIRYALPGAVVLAASFSIWFLSVSTLQKIHQMEVAHSDSTEWTLARVEVDFLNFRHSVDAASAPADLADMRRRFDVLYSRIKLVAEASAYEVLRWDAEYVTSIHRAIRFIEDTAIIMDGADSDLLASLPRLAVAADAIHPDLRYLAVSGLRKFSAISDENRESVLLSIKKLALITCGLVVLLSAVSARTSLLARLNARAARRQQETAEGLNTIISTSLDAVLVLDRDGRIVEYNGAAERIFGHSEAEAAGHHVRLLVPTFNGVSAGNSNAELFTALKAETVGRGLVEMDARRRDGDIFPIELSVAATSIGDETRVVVFVRDITQRRANEGLLIEARDRALAGEKAKANFLAVMSHEMRTPLNGVLGTLTLLADTRLTKRQAKMISNMEVSGRLLLQHINDVLEISKHDAGHVQVVEAPFSLDLLVGDLIATHESLARANGNTITVVWTTSPPKGVVGDAGRLTQVLANYLSNAIKFTRDGRIEIEVSSLGRAGDRTAFEFSVRDQGIGIDETQQARVFENFVTLDSSYARRTGGTGLGLGIAKEMAEAMGGTVGVRSREGEGCTFWARIAFPVLDRLPTAVAGPNLPFAGRPLRILVVDDNQINRDVMTGMLTADGHVVITACDGAQGVKLAAGNDFDVILMDVSMPVMDGLEASRRIRGGGGRSRSVPIFAVTAHALPEEIEEFCAAGITDCITKPIDRSRLRTVLVGLEAADSVALPPDAATLVSVGMIDRERIENLRDSIGAGETRTLLARFIEDTDKTLRPMTGEDASVLPMQTLLAEAHRISGAAGLFGASELRAVLVHIQTDGKVGRDAAARQRLADLPAIWERTRAELLNLRSG